jgi:hypothetical protein
MLRGCSAACEVLYMHDWWEFSRFGIKNSSPILKNLKYRVFWVFLGKVGLQWPKSKNPSNPTPFGIKNKNKRTEKAKKKKFKKSKIKKKGGGGLLYVRKSLLCHFKLPS